MKHNCTNATCSLQTHKFLSTLVVKFCINIAKNQLLLFNVDSTPLLDLINFWIAGSTINQGKDQLVVKFDEGTNSMPLSETCFKTIVLPTMYKEYDKFKKKHGYCSKIWVERV